MECAGVIDAVGDTVTEVAPGDRVMATTGNGAFGEMVNCPAARVYKIPDAMPYEIAAGFPITYGPTWHALVDRGRMNQGAVLLVHGAAGRRGLHPVQTRPATGG